MRDPQLLEDLLNANSEDDVIDLLNKRGLLRRGKPWAKERVLAVLGEPAVAGTYDWGRRDPKTGALRDEDYWVEIPVEPILDKDQVRSFWAFLVTLEHQESLAVSRHVIVARVPRQPFEPPFEQHARP